MFDPSAGLGAGRRLAKERHRCGSLAPHTERLRPPPRSSACRRPSYLSCSMATPMPDRAVRAGVIPPECRFLRIRPRRFTDPRCRLSRGQAFGATGLPPRRRVSRWAVSRVARTSRSSGMISCWDGQVTATPATGRSLWSDDGGGHRREARRHLAVFGGVPALPGLGQQHAQRAERRRSVAVPVDERVLVREQRADLGRRERRQDGPAARGEVGGQPHSDVGDQRRTARARSSTTYSTSRPCSTARCADCPTRSASAASGRRAIR